MEFLTALWLPIVISSVFVFVMSSLIHMVFKYHNGDNKKVPNEDAVMSAIRALKIPPGDYIVPRCETTKEMKTPEFAKKWEEGPAVVMTIMKPGPMKMGPSLAIWFVFTLIINVFAAYIASHAVPWGGSYLSVFRFVGCSTFMAYAFGVIPNSIWYQRSWGTTFRFVLDGLLYALVTAGVFGWLWPKGM